MEGRWRPGPVLPVEFVRKSSDDRVTLVPWGTHLSPTFWAQAALTKIDEACENLWVREGRPKYRFIHYTTGDGLRAWRGEVQDQDHTLDISEAVGKWLETQSVVDAAIWTGLPPAGFNVEIPDLACQVVKHLRGLDELAMHRAREYIQLAPDSIRTPIRSAIEHELGWTPQALPADLFERDTEE